MKRGFLAAAPGAGSVPCRRLGMVLLGAMVGFAARPAVATDAEFSRALSESGCSPARVVPLPATTGVVAYTVTCVGNPPRTVSVFCSNNSCTVSDKRDDGALDPGAKRSP